jgi:hypothetical protein
MIGPAATWQAGSARLSGTVLADSDTGKGSPIGLFVVLLLVIAVYFLYRSMSRHVRDLPDKFPQPNSAELAADGQPAPGTETDVVTEPPVVTKPVVGKPIDAKPPAMGKPPIPNDQPRPERSS